MEVDATTGLLKKRDRHSMMMLERAPKTVGIQLGRSTTKNQYCLRLGLWRWTYIDTSAQISLRRVPRATSSAFIVTKTRLHGSSAGYYSFRTLTSIETYCS